VDTNLSPSYMGLFTIALLAWPLLEE
jgi:hypothetical protein